MTPSYSARQIIYVNEISDIHTVCVLMDLAAVISGNVTEFPQDTWLTYIL
jgi:hypothetical protein